MHELKEIILKHGIKTAHLLDQLTKSLVSSCLDILLPQFLDLVNTSLQSGYFDGVKFARIKPLLKKMDMDCSQLLSYRPISNLSFISKIIERVVAKQLNEHMTKNKLHIDSQHGYKSGHSTETLLLKLYYDILVAIDQNRGVVVLLVDLSSAFDTVQHDLLLNILTLTSPGFSNPSQPGGGELNSKPTIVRALFFGTKVAHIKPRKNAYFELFPIFGFGAAGGRNFRKSKFRKFS